MREPKSVLFIIFGKGIEPHYAEMIVIWKDKQKEGGLIEWWKGAELFLDQPIQIADFGAVIS